LIALLFEALNLSADFSGEGNLIKLFSGENLPPSPSSFSLETLESGDGYTISEGGAVC
jgi:hypothetical protein